MKKLKEKLLLRLFGIKPKPTEPFLPQKLTNYSPVLARSAEDFNKWSSNLFLNSHKN